MMKIILITTILFYSSNWVEPLEIPVVTNIQDIIGLAHDVGDIAAGNIPFKNFFSPAVNPLLPVLDKLDGITEQIENLDTKLDDLLATLIARLPLEDQINTDIRELQRLISVTDDIFNEFLEYSENVTIFDEDTLEEYITYVTSTRTGNLLAILNQIMDIVVPRATALTRTGFLENMLQKRKMMSAQELCNPQISFQNRLLQIYNLLSITEMKSFLATTFGFRLKMEIKKTKSIGEFKRAESAFIMRLDQYLAEFKKVMSKTSREIYRCDSDSNADETTFVEFEGLFTAIVLNEHQTGTLCRSNCPYVGGRGYDECYTYGHNVCTDHPCRGFFYDCRWIGGDVDMCEYPGYTPKRYDWVRSYSNGWYGEDSVCSNGTYKEIRSVGLDFFDCDTCICRCEEYDADSRAVRTFSLRPQISNIARNRVVSDVTFIKKDRMIHMQIQEAPLLPVGQMAKNESRWIDVENFMYLKNVTGGGFLLLDDYGDSIEMIRDVDYTFIRRDHNKLNLDDISAGPNYVLTGVKLGLESDDYYESSSEKRRSTSPIQLEIHVTPFNYATGELVPTSDNPSIWLTASTQPRFPSAYSYVRTQVAKGSDKVYKHESVVNLPNLKPNRYVEFQQSSIHSDAGQSTVPFMDSRPVAINNSLAFDGLGLSYRGHEGYGGFVILKPLTLDATNYMDTAMTDEQQNYYMRSYRQPAANKPPRRERGSRRRDY